MQVKKYALILVVITVSFFGFCIENIFMSFRWGHMDNRNSVLPFILGYGLSMLGIYLLFGTPLSPKFFTNPLALNGELARGIYYFAIAFLCVSIGEIVIGQITEWVCGVVWWNYSTIPLHLTKYTSVPTSIGFALIITIFMKYGFYPLWSLFSKMKYQTLVFISISLLIVITLDTLNSMLYMLSHRSMLNLWRVEFKKPLKYLFFRNHI